MDLVFSPCKTIGLDSISQKHPQGQKDIQLFSWCLWLQEGKTLSRKPETQQVDRKILSPLPAIKEFGKSDLVDHNENGAEVVGYTVT